MRPDKALRVAYEILRWGPTPAAGYAASAIRRPDKTAPIDELGTLTFAAVQDRANRLANGHSDEGTGEGDIVAILCRNPRAFVDATVTPSKLGATGLYLN